MSKTSRTAISTLVAVGLAGALAGSWAGPASAAPGQVCYFGECSASSTPAAPSASPQARVLSKHGSWSAVLIGQGVMIVDQFANGSKFAILAYPEGKFGLMLMHPEWRLQHGRQAEMSIRIDGTAYNGKAVANEKGMLEVNDVSKALLTAFYRGRQGQIVVGDYRFDMTNLADATAVIDDVIAHLKTASR